MKYCNECLEECDYYADAEAELCEHCVDDRIKRNNAEERRKLIEKARSFNVPGHGPDFEKMTNEQIENHIKFIEKTFEMAFSKDENKLFAECQRYISRNSGDDNKAAE